MAEEKLYYRNLHNGEVREFPPGWYQNLTGKGEYSSTWEKASKADFVEYLAKHGYGPDGKKLADTEAVSSQTDEAKLAALTGTDSGNGNTPPPVVPPAEKTKAPAKPAAAKPEPPKVAGGKAAAAKPSSQTAAIEAAKDTLDDANKGTDDDTSDLTDTNKEGGDIAPETGATEEKDADSSGQAGEELKDGQTAAQVAANQQ